MALKNINYCHLSAEITFVVGSREQWGKGIASYAVGEVISIAKNEMGLEKIYAGCAHLNEGSKKVLLNNGFSLEGIRRSHLCYGGIRMDQLDYGLLI